MDKGRMTSSTTEGESSGNSKRTCRHVLGSRTDAKNDSSCDTRSQSACKSVLGVPELLEHILLFLPATGIVTARCVSHYWCNVVVGSSDFQKKLFLRLSGKPPEFWALVEMPGGIYTGKQGINYSIQKIDQIQDAAETDSPDVADTLLEIVELNPMMKTRLNFGLRGPFDIRIFGTRSGDLSPRNHVTYTGSLASLKRNAAMYLTDPPCCDVEFSI